MTSAGKVLSPVPINDSPGNPRVNSGPPAIPPFPTGNDGPANFELELPSVWDERSFGLVPSSGPENVYNFA